MEKPGAFYTVLPASAGAGTLSAGLVEIDLRAGHVLVHPRFKLLPGYQHTSADVQRRYGHGHGAHSGDFAERRFGL